MAQWDKNDQQITHNPNLFESFVQTDKDGNPISVSGLPGNYNIVAGNVSGISSVHKFGKVNGTASGNYSTVWTAADTLATILYPWDTAAGTVTLVSTSADDTAAGSGAQTVRVEGLDSDYNEISEDFTMAGLSNTSASTNTFLRVNRAYVLTGDTNVGTISVNNGATLVTQISAGTGQTLQCLYTIPAGKTGYLIEVQASSSKNISTNVAVFIREFGGVFRIRTDFKLFQNNSTIKYNFPISIPEKSDIEVRIEGATNNSVSADMDILLVDNA
jgi:hypothetical protein